MRKLSLLLLFAVIVPAIAADPDLSSYPSPFISEKRFDAIIAVGDDAPSSDALAATDIATALQALVSKQLPETKLASEVTKPYAQNLILIGNGCNNKLTALVLGNADRCYDGIPEDAGRITLVSTHGITALVVDGPSSRTVRRAARVLARHGAFSLSGMQMLVLGTLDNPRVAAPDNAAATEPVEFVIELEDTSCETAADCAWSEFCSEQFGCLSLECPAGFLPKNHACQRDVKEPPRIMTSIINQTAAADAANSSDAAASGMQQRNPLVRLISWLLALF